MVYRFIILIARFVMRALGMRRRLTGLENLPASGGAVLAITHFSYLDFVLAGWVSREKNKRLVRFLATAKSFKHPVVGPLMRSMKHVPVERDGGGGAYRIAVQRLQQGELVGVFPESRVTRSFELLPFKAGAARMAGQAGVPLVPVVIWGSHRVITRSHPFSLRKAFRTPITLVVGEPLHPTPDDDPVAVTAKLQLQMNAMLHAAQEAYPVTAPPGAWWQPARLGGGAPTPDEALVLDADDPVVRKDAQRTSTSEERKAQ